MESRYSDNTSEKSLPNGDTLELKKSRSIPKRMHSFTQESDLNKGIFSSISEGLSAEMDEYGVVSKIYCCGNSVQREAKLIAGFDTLLALGAIIGIATVFVLMKSEELALERILRIEGPNGDIQAFFDMPSETRVVAVSIVIAVLIVRIGLGLMLLLGAAKKYTTLLLGWCTSTIALHLYAAVIAIVGILYLHNKLIIGVVIIVETLYKWYSLWIVKILLKEIRTVREVRRELGEACLSNMDSTTATAI